MGERQFAPRRGLPVYVAVQFDCPIASLNAASVKDRYVALRSHSARSRQPSAFRPNEASTATVCYVRFTALAVGGERRREGLEAGATRGVALSQDHGV